MRAPSPHAVRRLLLCALALGALGACEFDKVTVAPGREQPVVHAVLNPFGGTQFTVLVERTLTGRVTPPEVAADSLDPIVSGGGVPISGATVDINGAIGIEDASVRADGRGRGVYRFRNMPPPVFVPRTNETLIVRGGLYTLRVTTPEGEMVTGRTTVPSMRLLPDTLPSVTFDRENDTYPFAWEQAMQAHRYALVIQTPYGQFQLFTADTSFLVRGDLRNFFAEDVPRVFVPGFLQTLQVFAVDTNYFDYYRSSSNPFTGLGIIDRLDGGTGVFGSITPMRTSRLEVVAPIDEEARGEGVWVYADASPSPTRLTLWFDGNVVSGRWEDADELPRRRGVLGTRTGTQLSLQVLREQDAQRVVRLLTAEVVNDTLVTQDDAGVERRFVRPSS